MSRVLNIAHRGGRRLWPENTLYALREAAKAGFGAAEIDVQLTRDGALVLFHDFRLSRDLCRDRHGHWLKPRRGKRLPVIRDLTFTRLAELDVGRVRPRSAYGLRNGPLHPKDGEHLPLLSDAIAAVRAIDPGFRLFIEIKTAEGKRALSAAPEAVAEATLNELKRTHFARNAVLVGFDWPALLHARKLAPNIPCWFTTRRRLRTPFAPRWAGGFDPKKFGSIAKAIAAAGGQGWLCSARQASHRAVAEAHRLGLEFGVWTVNEKRAMRRLIDLGVDAICTDRPDFLAGFQFQRSR
jgi:glycerophosphoryl diester phosphodiesterase